MSTANKHVDVSYCSLAEFTVRNGCIATRSTYSSTKKVVCQLILNSNYLTSVIKTESPSKLKAKRVKTPPRSKYFLSLFLEYWFSYFLI